MNNGENGMKKNKCFDGLGFINIETTSRCNKCCKMCGRRRIERDYPELANWGDMKFSLLEKLSKEVPPKIVLAFHSNGEPTVYPKLGKSLKLFPNNIRVFDTNAKLIVEKANEIIDNIESMTISVIQDDPEGDDQYEIVKQFLEIKGDRKPMLVYRLLGKIEKRERWEKLPGLIANRTIHSPMGSFKYNTSPTIPEHGLCLDLLSHLVIDRFGFVHPCVRFDPKNDGIIGDVNKESLLNIWNGDKRKRWIDAHIMQRRDKIKLCSYCDFYGVATSD